MGAIGVKQEEMKFEIGQLVTTAGVHSLMKTDEKFAKHVGKCLARHIKGDWGELDEHDKRENEFSLIRRLRLLSCYQKKDNQTIYIITEADRSATTVLFPSEY